MTENEGDLISREALIGAIEKGEGISWERYGDNEVCVRKKYIDNAPTVDTYKEKYEELKEAYRLLSEAYEHEVTREEIPQGRWKCDTTYCYKCNQTNCGADMRGEEE
jgi:hypothetical protein